MSLVAPWIAFGLCILISLATGLRLWLSRRYRVHKVVYGSKEVEEEFRDLVALSWPVPPSIITHKQMLQSFKTFPAPPLRYERHTFPCAIWPELGDVAYEEVFLHESVSPRTPAAQTGAPRGVFIFVCPRIATPQIRFVRRTLEPLLRSGYRCYALISRGECGHLLNPERQKVYLDECWNIQDVFEMVRYLAAQPGGLPPVHFCGHSLGAMRVAHFLAQVGKLIRKQADEARGVASPVRHDGDNMLRHTWRGFDNAGTREVARLLQTRMASCSMLFPHYDCKQPLLSAIPRDIGWAMRPIIRQNEAALRGYLASALRKTKMAGRDPADVDPEAFDRYIAAEVDRLVENAENNLDKMCEFDANLMYLVAGQESVTEYYTSYVVTEEELREIAGLTRASRARALYFGTRDDTLTSGVFPHDYAAQGIEGRVLAVQFDRGEHIGTVLRDGSDVVSRFVLAVAESRIGGWAPAPVGEPVCG